MGYIGEIVSKGRQLTTLQIIEAPNMLFLYLLAVLGALFKPKWTNERTWTPLEVRASHAALAGQRPRMPPDAIKLPP